MKKIIYKSTVIKDFNDIVDNKTRTIGDEIYSDEERYKDLFKKGFIDKGEKIEDKVIINRKKEKTNK